MSELLITGHDQGLGKAMYDLASRGLGYNVHGIHGSNMRCGDKNRIAESMRQLPNITHVVNNYGINHLSWIGDTPSVDEDIILTNIMGPYWVINELVANGNPPCRVVNVASMTYRIPQRCSALYCASKAALVQMTKVMARELAPKGWQINAIAPGAIADTKMTHLTGQQVLRLREWSGQQADSYMLSLIPMGRITTKEEVVRAIFKLLEAEPYINGAVIDMTGGQ